MISKYLKEILASVSPEYYVTAEQLSASLGISPKTVRIRIKELNGILKDYKAEVVSKSRHGFILVCENFEMLEAIFHQENEDDSLPNTTEERVNFLLAYLINYGQYIKTETLCDFLYVSKTTLGVTIKKVEKILNQYGIVIDRRPNYGIKAIGEEFDFRRCLGDYFIKRNSLHLEGSGEEERVHIGKILYTLMNKHNIRLSETGFQNIVDYISVGIRRMKQGKFICFPEEKPDRIGGIEQALVEELVKSLTEYHGMVYNEDEKIYIALLLAGKRMVGDAHRDEINFVIHENIDRMVMKMLELIYDMYRVDFRSNFELRMALNQHIVPLDIRLRYHIPLENPMLDKIKEEYMMAFTMASHASVVLSEYYHREVSEDEVGYLALIFALALEQKDDQNNTRYNILIVCSSGKGSSRLLMYKYQQTFGKYIEQIFLCNQFELDKFDFSKIQYVFTTVPIFRKVPVPILEVGMFLDKNDVSNVWKMLQFGDVEYLEQYYKETAFFQHIEGKTKEEVVQNMCNLIQQQRKLPAGFYEAVLKREELYSTDFGNMIAFCHPYQVMTEDTFVYIGILDEPIQWSRNEVQVVFLVAVGEQEDEHIQRFYEATTKFFLKEDSIKELIEERSFHTLMRLLREIETENSH